MSHPTHLKVLSKVYTEPQRPYIKAAKERQKHAHLNKQKETPPPETNPKIGNESCRSSLTHPHTKSMQITPRIHIVSRRVPISTRISKGCVPSRGWDLYHSSYGKIKRGTNTISRSPGWDTLAIHVTSQRQPASQRNRSHNQVNEEGQVSK